MISSHVFPIILYNIKLYIYIVRYRSDIKILNFLLNFSNFFLNKKNLKWISPLKKTKKKKNILFQYIQSNPKSFLSIPFNKKKKQKCIFLMFWNEKMNIVTSLWLSIRIWPKYQKPFTSHFVHFILWFKCRF
jgi:hypothetical protein